MHISIYLVKTVVNVATSIGVTKVVRDIIQNNVTVETTADQAKVLIGSFVLGGMIAERATERTEEQIDKLTELYTRMTKEADKDTE